MQPPDNIVLIEHTWAWTADTQLEAVQWSVYCHVATMYCHPIAILGVWGKCGSFKLANNVNRANGTLFPILNVLCRHESFV